MLGTQDCALVCRLPLRWTSLRLPVLMCVLWVQVKVIPRVCGKVALLPVAAADSTTPPQGTGGGTEVSHLSEITLYIKYPPSYPSHTPPHFHLSARWLDTEVAPRLSGHLKGLFLPACPVVYEWIMYLQDEMIHQYTSCAPGR